MLLRPNMSQIGKEKSRSEIRDQWINDDPTGNGSCGILGATAALGLTDALLSKSGELSERRLSRIAASEKVGNRRPMNRVSSRYRATAWPQKRKMRPALMWKLF
jgi:hypothetical protein